MNCSYEEIIEAMGEPKWWNEVAAPRYLEFEPQHIENIYADDCCLALIECQGCGHPFKVAFSSSATYEFLDNRRPLSEVVQDGSLHFGDPPNIGCCAAGPTMNCMDIKVLEYWSRRNSKDFFREWERLPDLEVLLPDHPEHELAKENHGA